jgi:membrane-associated phospholipid phosphatase
MKIMESLMCRYADSSYRIQRFFTAITKPHLWLFQIQFNFYFIPSVTFWHNFLILIENKTMLMRACFLWLCIPLLCTFEFMNQSCAPATVPIELFSNDPFVRKELYQTTAVTLYFETLIFTRRLA